MKLSKNQLKKNNGTYTSTSTAIHGQVSYSQFLETKSQERFCDLSAYSKHLLSLTSHKYSAKCAVCSEKVYKKCTICGVSLHNMDSRGAAKGKNCFLEWHDANHFRLCYADRSLVGIKSLDWKPPTANKIRANTRIINRYKTR